jgi:glucose/arabinose dehydrogenase
MPHSIPARAKRATIGVCALICAGVWSLPRHAAAEDLAREEARTKKIEAILRRVRLPDGFSINLYALAPGARSLAVGREGKTIFVGTADDRVFVLTPGGERAASVETFAPSLQFVMPHGVCFSPDGALFLVERNKVSRFDGAEADWRDASSHMSVIVRSGDLIPRSEQSSGHSTRMCRVGPDGKLYISLGQPYNVAPPEKLALYEKTGIGGIIRLDRNGENREVFARGIRNSVGMDFNPVDGSLWFTDNQVDSMGDNIPPGEINRADRAGLNFGFPWYGGGHVRTNEYADDTPPKDVVFPEIEEDAHAADLGMIFYNGGMFPQRYRGGIFSAQHGSWDRSVPIGARLMFTKIGAAGRGGESEVFADGWNTGVNHYLGRPVDVAQLPDGSLLITDDQNGAVYRISYSAK